MKIIDNEFHYTSVSHVTLATQGHLKRVPLSTFLQNEFSLLLARFMTLLK